MTKRIFTIGRDEMGRPTIIKGRKVKVDVGYDPITEKFNELVFTGRKELLPKITDLMGIIQDVDVYVKTEDGKNILLDLLTQTAYTERRATITNDNGVPTPSAPPSNLTATTYKGKFFPRGMRMFLRGFRVYCKRTGSGTLTLAFSPQQGMGEIGTVVITPTSNWDWTGGFLTQFWNYDSMFVWVKACSADVSFGYDEALPSDGWTSSDSGVTWTNEVRRYFIRALGYGLTVGDVPVSGTINNIEIPSVASTRQFQHLDAIATGTESYDTAQVGAGETLIVMFLVNSDEDRDDLRPRIKCDGVQTLPIDTTIKAWNDTYVTSTTPGITIGIYDAVGNNYALIVTIHYSFKRKLEVGFYNAGAANRDGYVAYSYSKIS